MTELQGQAVKDYVMEDDLILMEERARKVEEECQVDETMCCSVQGSPVWLSKRRSLLHELETLLVRGIRWNRKLYAIT